MGSVENRKVKIPKGRRDNQRLPKRVSEMSKEVLEATLRKKRECNAKALQIVERLLENTTSEDWFLDCLQFISESHFQDVIEERTISLNCGYPLCPKKLKNIPSQQYHISTKLNKVYDITERKNFCSNQCYKASTYLKAQLLTSPLWMRDKEQIPKFKILPLELTSGGVGEEIDFGLKESLKGELKQMHTKEEAIKFTSISQFTRDSLSKLASDIEKEEEKLRQSRMENNQKDKGNVETKYDTPEVSCDSIKTNSMEVLKQPSETRHNPVKTENTHLDTTTRNVLPIQVSEESSKVGNSDETTENVGEISKNFKQIATEEVDVKRNGAIAITSSKLSDANSAKFKDTCSSNAQEDEKVLKPKKNKSSKKWESKNSSDVPPMTSAVIYIEKCLHEWFTFESMCFLFGEEKMKETVSEKGDCIKEYYKAVHNASWDSKIQEKYMAICRRLNIIEIEESRSDDKIAMKPLPNYSAIKEEARKLDLKVKAYYQGKTFENVDTVRVSETETNQESSFVLPLVDLHAQNALRRRIVLDCLNRILPDLLRTFGISSRDVSGDVRGLVTTFTLGAHNITFKPPEWSFLGLIIIKMLSIKDTRLKILLDGEQVTKYTTMMLMSFQQDGGYLDRLIAWLTDIDNFLCKK